MRNECATSASRAVLQYGFECCFENKIPLVVSVDCVRLVAYISQHGLHGEIHFAPGAGGTIEIESSLETTLQYPEQVWSWGVHRLPVDYGTVDGVARCDASQLGPQVWSFDESLGYLTLPGNESVKWQGKFALTGE